MSTARDTLNHVTELLAGGPLRDITEAELLLTAALHGGADSHRDAELERQLDVVRELSLQAATLLRVRIEQSPLAFTGYGTQAGGSMMPYTSGIEG